MHKVARYGFDVPYTCKAAPRTTEWGALLASIDTKALFVNFPITVLASVEKNHRQPVSVFRSQLRIRRSSFVHVDARQFELELGTDPS